MPNSNASQLSLVFILHGSGGNGFEMIKFTDSLQKLANNQKFILVYPNGYKHFWNECRKAATHIANIENINEQAFFMAMIQYFSKKYRIDTNAVYAAGFSGGGHMAYKLALTMSNQFKAIAAIVANLPDSNNMDCSEARIPISVMIVNGTEDEVNPYNGGEVKVQGIKLGNVRSTAETFQYWANLAGYSKYPKIASLPNLANDGKEIEKYSFSEKGKPNITLLKVIGGKHDYPSDVDLYTEVWNFFKERR